MISPYKAGWNAFLDGENKDQNPWERDSDDWKNWNNGYDAAQEEFGEDEYK